MAGGRTVGLSGAWAMGHRVGGRRPASLSAVRQAHMRQVMMTGTKEHPGEVGCIPPGLWSNNVVQLRCTTALPH